MSIIMIIFEYSKKENNMEAVFLFALLLIGLILGMFEEGILCQYNRNMYRDKWRYGNKTKHTIDEFDIIIDTKAHYWWMEYTVVWKRTGKKVLFPATCIGSNTIVGRYGHFINDDRADSFIREFYMNGNNTTEYKGTTIYKLFKHDANSHPSIPDGSIFYISFLDKERIYDVDISVVKYKIDQSTLNKE